MINEDSDTYILTTFPDLFQIIDGRIFFGEVLCGLYSSPLELNYEGNYVEVNPYDYRNSYYFQFTLRLGTNSRNADDNFLHIASDILLSDDICFHIFKYNIEILSTTFGKTMKRRIYDKEAIMRRHTINTIINE